ncbi:metal-dependent hydrolase [Halosimplex amylolyticum]|uniref:metal-dependent hydrolase n=1 Tax=Halosimplex amylolyticum TaxID=3396616 RepID=UPI003F565096
MDLLTHLFLPLTVAFVLRPELFNHPATFGIAGFGVLSDFDKFLGQPGLLHSLVTIVPICVVILAIERWYREEWRYAPVLSAIIGSHLVLDLIDGGPVPLLYPFVERGLGLQYPAQTVFGRGPIGLSIEGQIMTTRMAAPRPGYNAYGFLTGEGIAWALVFVIVFVGLRRQGRRGADTTRADGGEEL